MSSGAALAERFYRQAVRPIVERELPGVPVAAARLGSGSDILGYDDHISTDHDWGCRLTLVVPESVSAADIRALDEALERDLPDRFEEQPVRFITSWDQRVHHKVEIVTARLLAASRLGIDPLDGLEPADWLLLTGQSVLETTAGPVFEDPAGELARLRRLLEWYPHDVWLYVLASGWTRLCQEMPFVGRTGSRGDDIGSQVLTARLVRDVMHLAFLLERRWPPYPKWFGTAFSELPLAVVLAPALGQALSATSWPEREDGLATAITVVHNRQSELGLPAPGPAVTPFYNRPYRIANEDVDKALIAAITDPAVRALPIGVGSIEQWCDNVNVLSYPDRRAAFRGTGT